MQGSYVGDSIESVMGIMNGTTNFMLTKMELEGADYGAVLKEAQDLGFAEGSWAPLSPYGSGSSKADSEKRLPKRQPNPEICSVERKE